MTSNRYDVAMAGRRAMGSAACRHPAQLGATVRGLEAFPLDRFAA